MPIPSEYKKAVEKLSQAFADAYSGGINKKGFPFFFEAQAADQSLQSLLDERKQIVSGLSETSQKTSFLANEWVGPKFAAHVMAALSRDLHIRNLSRLDCYRSASLQANFSIMALKDSLKILQLVDGDTKAIDSPSASSANVA